MKIDYSERARALVGTRFRLQGRGTEGLDCVGLAVAAFQMEAHSVPRNYRARGDHEAAVRAFLCADFRRVPASQLRRGDLMLMRVAADQVHLGIRTDAGFVHADAGLKRVVEAPGMPAWPISAVYRKRRG